MSDTNQSTTTSAGSGDPAFPYDDRRDFEDASRGLHRHDRARRDPQRRGRRGLGHRRRSGSSTATGSPHGASRASGGSRSSCAKHGLFEVADGIYQVRGFDLSNITFVEGDTGVIVIDPLISDRDRGGGARALPRAPRRPARSSPSSTRTATSTTSAASRASSRRRTSTPGGARDRARGIPRARDLRERLRRHGDGPPRRVHVRRGPAARRAGQRRRRARAVDVGRHGRRSSRRPWTSRTPARSSRSTACASCSRWRPEPRRPPRCTSTSPTAGRCAWPRTRPTRCTTCSRCAAPSCATRTPGPATSTEAIERFGGDVDVVFASHHWPTWGTRPHRRVPLDPARPLRLPARPDAAAAEPGPHRQRDRRADRAAAGARGRVEHARLLRLGQPQREGDLPAVHGLVRRQPGAPLAAHAGRGRASGTSTSWAAPTRSSRRRGPRSTPATTAGRRRCSTTSCSPSPTTRRAKALLADALEQLGFGSENGTWRNAYLSGAMELRGGAFGTPTSRRLARDILAQLTPRPVLRRRRRSRSTARRRGTSTSPRGGCSPTTTARPTG